MFGALILLIGLPFTIYCSFKLGKEWNRAYFVKRHRILVLSTVVVIVILQVGMYGGFVKFSNDNLTYDFTCTEIILT